MKQAFFFLLLFFIPFSYSQKAEKGPKKKTVIGVFGIPKAFIIQELSIKGNQMISDSFIRSHIQLKKGSFYTKQKADEDLKHLFSLNFFEDIQIHKSYDKKNNLKLSYHFKERPFISIVKFNGNKKLTSSDLEEISLLEEYQFLDPDKLKKTLLAVKEKYKEKAYYLMESSYQLKKDPKNKNWNQLIININENSKLFIQSIYFIGNRNIESKALKRFMKNKERGLLSFLGSSGVYQPELMDQDLQLIEYYYRDQGYLNVRVQQPEISITADKKWLSLGFKVSEGPRYKMGEAYFEGDEEVSKFNLSKKEYFSFRALQEDIQSITALYKNKGYAFAEVKPLFQNDAMEENTVHIVFKVDKKELYKIRRIEITGNKQARDKVILRRFRINEGDFYNQSQIDLSRQLLEQLAIFEKVKISAQPLIRETDLSQPRKLDLKAEVKERDNTGEMTFAGGYNTQTKLYISGGLKKDNFFGLDQNVGLRVNMGFYDESVIFNYQNSYFLDTNWNFGFDIFNSANQNFTGSSSSLFFGQDYLTYFSLSTGFSFSLGRYVNNFSSLFVKYKLSNEKLSNDPIFVLRKLPVLSSIFGSFKNSQTSSDTGSQELSPLKDLRFLKFNDIYDLKSASGLDSSLSLVWEYDKRNDRFYASKGFLTRLSVEHSGFGGDFNYTKSEGMFRHYYKPFWKLVIKNRLDLAWVFSNSKEIPFTQLFLLGGPYDLRGFVVNSQGPKKYSQKAYDYALNRNQEIQNENSDHDLISSPKDFALRPYGGSQKFIYTLEFEIPVFERIGLRAAAFLDLGEANNGLKFDLKDQLRANAGVGLRWRSPFGPLNLDWAFPYKARKQHQENSWEFQFSVGSHL